MAPMPSTMPDDRAPVSDVVGIGFGPSNLALAAAIDEYNDTAAKGNHLGAAFLERQHAFGWHRGMLLDGATIQVSFLKDLVTMRNPSSAFSFLSYLYTNDRLVDFINHKSLFPTRIEFHDYLEWVAAQLDRFVEYGTEVLDVQPVTREGTVVAFDVIARQAGPGGGMVVRRGRNLVVATGLRPHLPDGVHSCERIWHNEELLTRLPHLTNRPHRRFVVVGAGQSAAETVEYLHRHFPDAEVCAVFSRYGYSPADDSPFANRIFDPAAVESFFVAPDEVKQKLLDYHANTNYSVVDQELIEELYRRSYQEKVRGRQRLRIMNTSRVTRVEHTARGLQVTVEELPTGDTRSLDADTIIYATGYRPSDPLDLLGEAGGLCHLDDQGDVRVERDYRVATADHVLGGIYLQGPTEHTHGITSTLLSNTAGRAGEILRSITRHSPLARHPLDSAVDATIDATVTGSLYAEGSLSDAVYARK